MKARFYRFWSSRSFTRSLSIVAVAVVAFAALELVAPQQALAGVWCCNATKCVCDASLLCPSTYPSNTFKSCGVTGQIADKGTINSTLDCKETAQPSEEPLFGNGGVFWDSTSVGRSARLDCTVSGSADPSHDGTGVCQFDILYSRAAGLQTACSPDSQNPGKFIRSHVAFCNQVGDGSHQQDLTVEGRVQCDSSLQPGPEPKVRPPFCENDACILRTGINVMNNQHCSQVFEADTSVGLVAGQVLRLTQTFGQNDNQCAKPPTSVSPAIMKFCNGNHWDGSDVECIFTGNQKAVITGVADNEFPFDVFFSPQTLNVTCNNSDVWRFRISGNDQINPAVIDVESLRVEGFEGVSCQAAVTKKVQGKTITYRDCEINACPQGTPPPPQLGRFVAAGRDPITLNFLLHVTGTLDGVPPVELGNPIFGEQLVTTSGQ